MSNSSNPSTKNTFRAVKGVTLTPPIIGRITMGHTEFSGSGPDIQAVSVADDSFNITTLVQNKVDRRWELHPIQETIKSGSDKLRAIPVVIAYNDPGLNVTNSFSVFDPISNRVTCSGDGESARRTEGAETTTFKCSGPETCVWGIQHRCKSFTRAYFRIEGQDDELGNFVLRTTSWNSLQRLASRLNELYALTGGRIAGMPMMLTMNDKTSKASMYEPFQFVDLVPRPGSSLIKAIGEAVAFQEAYEDAGLNLEALEECLRSGLEQSRLSDEIEDFEEFLSDGEFFGAVQAKATVRPGGLRGLTMVSEQLREKHATANSTPPAQESSPDPDNHDLLSLEAVGR